MCCINQNCLLLLWHMLGRNTAVKMVNAKPSFSYGLLVVYLPLTFTNTAPFTISMGYTRRS